MRNLPPLNTLRVFETAGKSLNFTVAANQLNVTQSAISRQIKQLESYLGVPLFIRLHHKMELTDAGEQLLQKLIHSFDLMEESIANIRPHNQRQRLTILVPPTFATRYLVPKLATFQKNYPEFEISIQDKLHEHTIFDCVIRFGLSEKARFVSQLLRLEQHIAVCSPKLLERGAHLENESHHLLHVTDEGKRMDVWKNWLKASGLKGQVNSNIGLEFSTLCQVITAVKSGAGFAVIDKAMIKKELACGSLIQFNDTQVSGPYGYWLDVIPEKQGLLRVKYFTDWIKSY